MEAVACNKIAEKVKGTDLYILVVSENCDHCHELLGKIETLGLSRPIMVATYEQCSSDIDAVVSTEAFPTLVHLDRGKEVRRAVGLDDIYDFEKPQSVAQDDVSATTKAEQEPPEEEAEGGSQ